MSKDKEIFMQYLDYPREITIETTGVCNAHCVFCPHEHLDRKNDSMSEDLFNKIIQQLKEIPQEHFFVISPFKVNEPLMDPKIFERIELINSQIPNAFLRLFSNFNSATEDDIIQISKIKNLYDFDISINSLDSEEYCKLMGLDLSQTVQNIFMLLKFVRQNGLNMCVPKITLSRVSITPESDMRYLKNVRFLFDDYLDLINPIVITRGEFIDHMHNEEPALQDAQCTRWMEINICCNGVVAFCCMDAKGAYSWGNMNENTILEIYNQPQFRRLRTESVHKKDVIPCRYCSI